MKKSLITLFAIIIINTASAQFDDLMKRWKVGTEKEVFGNKITRLEGEDDKYSITNIGYQTYEQIKSEINDKADKEMWQEDKKKERLSIADKYQAGGSFRIYIERITIESANMEYFTVIVQDSALKEILRQDFKSKIPEVPSNGGQWWNTTGLWLKEKAKTPLYIFIIDKLSEKRFKFIYKG